MTRNLRQLNFVSYDGTLLPSVLKRVHGSDNKAHSDFTTVLRPKKKGQPHGTTACPTLHDKGNRRSNDVVRGDLFTHPSSLVSTVLTLTCSSDASVNKTWRCVFPRSGVQQARELNAFLAWSTSVRLFWSRLLTHHSCLERSLFNFSSSLFSGCTQPRPLIPTTTSNDESKRYATNDNCS